MTPTPSGSYVELQICADKPGSVVEISDTNNCAAASTKAVIVNRPDLVISQNPTPVQTGTFTHGDTLSFTGKVQNTGGFPVGDVTLFRNQFKVHRSGGSIDTLPHVSGSDITGLTVSPAAGSEKSVTSGTWNAVAGRHTLELCADKPSDDIMEGDEDNNCSPSDISVGATTIEVLPQKPVVFPTTSTVCGGHVDLSYSGGAGGVNFRLFHNTANTLPYPTDLGSADTLSGQNGLSTFDTGTPGTTYYYRVDAIGPDNLTNGSDRPKSAVASATCPANTVDLNATAVTVNGALMTGTALTFTGTVVNSGTVATPSNVDFDNTFTLTLADGSTVTRVGNTLRNQNPGTGAAQTSTSASWVAEAGVHTVTFCTDRPTSKITESNESDLSNCRHTDFTVAGSPPPPSDLAVTLTASPAGNTAAPLSDVSLTASVTGAAQGAVTYAFDYASDGVDVTKTISTPTVGNTSYSTVAPDLHTYTDSGKYTAHVTVTRGGRTAEATTLINVNPTLTVVPGPLCQQTTSSWGTTLGATSYKIYRSPTGQPGTFALKQTLSSSSRSYADADPTLVANQPYYYMLEAVTDRGSLWSESKGSLSGISCAQSKTLTVSVTLGNGSITSGDGKISCTISGGSCAASYVQGTVVVLTADIGTSRRLQGWDGDCDFADTNPQCNLTMSTDHTASAAFTGGGGQPPDGPPQVTCDSTPFTPSTITQGNSATWNARPTGGANGSYESFDFYFDDNDDGIYETVRHSDLNPPAVRSGQTYSVTKDYPTVGVKRARVEVTDSNFVTSDPPTACSTTVTVVPQTVCDPNAANFTLAAKNPPAQIYAEDYTTNNSSNSTGMTVLPLSCFTDPVDLVAKVNLEDSVVSNGQNLTFMQGGVPKRLTFTSVTGALTSTALSGSNSYATGAQISLQKSGSAMTATADYTFYVCGIGRGNGRISNCVPVTLHVGQTPPVNPPPGGGSGSTLPLFEEF